jgi:hypothetical protein
MGCEGARDRDSVRHGPAPLPATLTRMLAFRPLLEFALAGVPVALITLAVGWAWVALVFQAG